MLLLLGERVAKDFSQVVQIFDYHLLSREHGPLLCLLHAMLTISISHENSGPYTVTEQFSLLSACNALALGTRPLMCLPSNSAINSPFSFKNSHKFHHVKGTCRNPIPSWHFSWDDHTSGLLMLHFPLMLVLHQSSGMQYLPEVLVHYEASKKGT